MNEEDKTKYVLVPCNVFMHQLENLPFLKCIFWNCGESISLCEQASKYVDFSIGFKGPIPDRAAVHFSKLFYDLLACGRCILAASESARVVFNTHGGDYNSPCLARKNGVDSNNYFAKNLGDF